MSDSNFDDFQDGYQAEFQAGASEFELGEAGFSRLRLLARGLPADSFAGDEPLPLLDVEGALAKVLAGAANAPEVPAAGDLRDPDPRRAVPLRWSTLLAAAMLLASVAAPALVRNRVPNPRANAPVPTAWLAGVSSTSAVVFWSPEGK